MPKTTGRNANETIATEIRMILARRMIKSGSLADVVGLTRPQLSRRLNLRTPFTAADVAAIAKALDVSVAVLYGERDSWIESSAR